MAVDAGKSVDDLGSHEYARRTDRESAHGNGEVGLYRSCVPPDGARRLGAQRPPARWRSDSDDRLRSRTRDGIHRARMASHIEDSFMTVTQDITRRSGRIVLTLAVVAI